MPPTSSPRSLPAPPATGDELVGRYRASESPDHAGSARVGSVPKAVTIGWVAGAIEPTSDDAVAESCTRARRRPFRFDDSPSVRVRHQEVDGCGVVIVVRVGDAKSVEGSLFCFAPPKRDVDTSLGCRPRQSSPDGGCRGAPPFSGGPDYGMCAVVGGDSQPAGRNVQTPRTVPARRDRWRQRRRCWTRPHRAPPAAGGRDSGP
jgi:hypothetical protein